MPATKCAHCGHRILSSAVHFCENCGEALLPQEDNISTSATTHHSPKTHYTPDLYASPKSTTYTSQSLVQTKPTRLPIALPKNEDTNPYRPSTISSPAKISLTKSYQNAYHLTSQSRQYPFGYPRRAPDVEGVIAEVHSQQELPSASYDFAISIIKLIRDIIWYVPGDSDKKERVLITTIRVKSKDDALHDVRLEGRLTGGNLSLGDEVALWGRKKRGVLFMRKGYNNTSKSSISSTTTSSSIPFFLLIFVLIIIALVIIFSFPLDFPK